jgi:ABC-type Na+ efflux pump permease subunit
MSGTKPQTNSERENLTDGSKSSGDINHVNTPTTTKEIIQETAEVLRGEGEPISERAPAVPFLVVFLSYFLVLSLFGIVAFCLWRFVFRA